MTPATSDEQTRFASLLPGIEGRLKHGFARDPELKEELIAIGVGHAFLLFLSATRRGKKVTAGTLAYYAKRIKEKFGVKMSYTDVHTAVSPWRYCDYDARVPGAGTLAATFYAYGQLLLNDQRVYGPTQSEATYQWLWAGLESGSYGWVYTNYNLLKEPLDVAFHLMKNWQAMGMRSN